MSQITINGATHHFLTEQQNLVLATIRRDGSPQISPLWYLWDGKTFVMSTIDTTAKWLNLQRDSRCSGCVDEPGTGRMVVAYGTAVLQADSVWEDTSRLVAKYYPGDPVGADRHVERLRSGPRRVLIRLQPSRLLTRKLDQ